VPKFRENQTIILITFLVVPGQIMFPDWFFQAMERMKYITILNILSKLLFTIAIFVFIKEKSDYILQPLFLSLGSVLSGIISMYFILVRWKVKLKCPSLPAIFSTIKGSTDVFLNNIVPNFYNSFSTLLLGFYGGSVSNGILDAGNRFVGISQQFMNIIARTFFPYLSRKIDKHKLYVKLNFYLSISFSAILFLFAPVLIKSFFTPEFYDAILITRILSLSVFFISIRNTYGTHYMLLYGFEKELRNLTFYGSFVGLLLAFPLIFYFDFIGAAINIIIAQAVMAIIVVVKAKKIKKLTTHNV
jgi:PST family polysaccharide transporter